MGTKQEAIDQIALLIKKHAIDLSEIKKKVQQSQKSHSIIKRFCGVLGGILIFCGFSVYITQHWVDMSSVTRIMITLGAGICFLILALAASHQAKYEKILTPLFILAALFETQGVFTVLHELFGWPMETHGVALTAFGTIFLQQVILFVQQKRTVLLFLAIGLGMMFLAVLLDTLAVSWNYIAILLGVAAMGIAYQTDHTRYDSIVPWGYFLGGEGFLAGLFNVLRGTRVELLYLGVSMLVIYLSTFVRSRALLFIGMVAMIFYTGYFTKQHLIQSVGWPIALVLSGFVMLGVSAMVMNVNKTLKK